MKLNGLILVALGATLGLSSCGTADILGPVEPEDVLITLDVSGGFAGIGFGVVVDGAAGEARSSCALCARPVDPILLPLSSQQIAGLAQSLDDSGVLDMDGRDFGNQCCDQFYVDLTYERGERSAHIQGTQSLLPLELQGPVADLSALAQGRVPVLVSPDTRDTDWPRDQYALGEVVVVGRTLTAEVTYGGGCEPHTMDLVAWGGWMESFPVQIEALITHDDSDDPCDAVVTETRVFDLVPLARAYAEAYGGAGGLPVVLRLWDPGASEPRLIDLGS